MEHESTDYESRMLALLAELLLLENQRFAESDGESRHYCLPNAADAGTAGGKKEPGSCLRHF